jgi:hypothetical protein
MADNSSQPNRISRVAGWPKILGFLLLVGCVGAAAFIIGSNVRSPESVALERATDSIPVTTAVQQRVVVDSTVVPGTVQAGDITAATTFVPDGTARAIASAIAVRPGDLVVSGTWLGSISGRPLFAIEMEIPMYRDLQAGMKGPDVTSFQAGLAAAGFDVEQSGELDWETLHAVSEMYERIDVDAPAEAIDSREFVAIPHPGVALDTAGIGDAVSDDSPLVSIQTSPVRVVARVNLLEAEAFQLNTPVHVSIAGDTFDAAVTGVSSFVEEDTAAGKLSGVDITVDLPRDVVAATDTPATVEAAKAGEPSLAVPLTAVRQDGTRTFILRQPEHGGHPQEVDIKILATGGGWVGFTSAERLEVGDPVVVSP